MRTFKTASRISLVAALILSISAGPAAASSGAERADYYKGLDLYQRRDYRGSIEAFKAQLAKTPEDKSVQKWLQKAESRLTGADRAVSGTSWIDMPAKGDATNYEQGIAHYRDGRYEEAAQSFRKYLAQNPKHVPTKQWIALLESHLSPKVAPQPSSAPGSRQFTVENRQILPPVPPLGSLSLPTSAAAPVPELAAVPSDAAAARAELERAKKDLDLRTEQVARSITQTKRALAQTDEAEKVNRALVAEIEALKAAKPAQPAAAPVSTAEITARDKRIGELESELKLLQADLERAQKGDRAQELAFLEKKQALLQDELKAKTAEAESARNELESIKSAQASVMTSAQASEESARQALEAMTAEVTAASRRVEDAQKSLEAAKREAAESRAAGEALEAERAGLERRIQELQDASGTELGKYQRAAEEFQIDNSKLREELGIAEKHAAEAEDTLARITRSYQEAEDARTAAEMKLAETSRRAAAAADVSNELAALRGRLSSEIRSKETSLKEFQTQSTELKSQIVYAESALSRQTRDANALREALDQSKTRLKELETERLWYEDQIAGLKNSAAQVDQKISELESLLAASRQESEDLRSQVIDLTQRLELAKQARAESEQSAEEARRQSEALSAENQSLLATLDETRQSISANEARMAEDRTALYAEIEKQSALLKQAQAQFMRKEHEYLARAENAELLLKDTQVRAEQAAERYQKSEALRADAERKLVQVAKDYRALKAELAALKSAQSAWETDLRHKERMMREAFDNAASARAETSEIQTTLEESRAQGLRLAQDLQTEKLRRQSAEEELSRASQRLSAIRASLTEIDGDGVAAVRVEE